MTSELPVTQFRIISDQDMKLTDGQLIELRLKAVELGVQIATASGKPHHAPYIAGDLYKFLLTGRKPEGPQQRKKDALDEGAT
jgi:hypothetical protein